MQAGSGAKNPPWARSNVNSGMTGMNPQIMDTNMMSQQGMMGYQQSQAVYNPNMMQGQAGMGMGMGAQMPMNQMAQGQMYPGNVVAYPTPRSMNPGMYQNSQSNQSGSSNDQRVFTGTVTKTHNDFGFVDHDVFYQTSVCAKGVIPKVNDRVLVEANYNPNMPFKWNATRVQVLPKSGPNQKQNNQKSGNYNAVPPPLNNKKNMPNRREDRMPDRMPDRIPPRREERKRSRSRSRSRSPARRDSRTRRESPPRKRPVVHQPSPVKYVVRVPRMPLDITKLDVPALSQRYTNMYIPSDFFNAQVKWGETFPPQMPFSLNNPCSYHIMSKDVENPTPNDAVLEPPDADYRFSAKVMLISMPTLESLYQKCGLTKSDEKDKDSKSRSRDSKNPLHPTRLIKFLVGQRGKGGENFAIGGPWSPSLDGENPDSDPSVLVKTAIRTCKALTGIDLSACAQWFRMVEFYYWRESSTTGKGRLETVVLFLPDVWSARPSRIEWSNIQERYKAACDAAVKKLESPEAPMPVPATPASDAAADKTIDTSTDAANSSTITIDENDDEEEKIEPTHYSMLDMKTIKVDQLRQELRARNSSCKGLRAQLVSRLSKLLKAEEEEESKPKEIMDVEDEEEKDDAKEKDVSVVADKEADKEEKKQEEKKEEAKDKKEDPKEKEKREKEKEEAKKKLEKEKQQLISRYELPSTPYLIVHPNSTAKGGKFTSSVATLSLMLDYRITDNKEHSFELFVFAELFNEMLMRDFGFYIYKTLYTLPEKTEEPKDKKEDKENGGEDKKDEKKDSAEVEKEDDKKDDKAKVDDKDKKAEDKDKKSDEKDKKGDDKKVDEKDKDKKDDKDKKEGKDKKDDKKDDKRDARRRDRRESHSDDERSSSPRRRSRGVELPPDPYLLLSIVYFDTSRCGYINRRDIQNLFMSLGLQLSRSQIKNIIEKVCVKDNFTYKSLVQAIKDLSSASSDATQDMPLESPNVDAVPSNIAELEATIAQGNRELLPLFDRVTKEGSGSNETQDVSHTGVVIYKNRVIDVGALVAAEQRNATLRCKLEESLEQTRKALKQARQAAASTQQAERGAVSQLSDVSQHLAAARARITSLTASSKIFHSALQAIQSKVESVINIKFEEEDVEVVNGPSKTETGIKVEKQEVKSVKNEAKTEVKEDIKEVTEMDLDEKE